MLTDKPRPQDRLSWAVTAVCCLYIVWATHYFTVNVAAFGGLADGLGAGMVPWTTTAMIAASRSVFSYVVAALLIAALIAKELSRLSRDVKLAVTTVIYMAVSWFLQIATEAVFLPIFEAAKKIQG